MADQDYFDSRIKKTDSCWLWTGPKFNHGYGCVVRGKKKRLLAHRVAYELFVGNIPDGAVVCHSCDTPLCVNPQHLFIGTQKDNVADMICKGRDYRGGPQLGSSNPASKLSEQDVREIRKTPKNRGVGRLLARRFNVSEATISLIRSGRRWSHG